MAQKKKTAEHRRLEEDATRAANWKRWGPYLSERQWGTVREDYSADGDCWNYFPHDHARSRAYRWGEDGLLGICDRECRMCFSIALWNERDPILKERLFGLTGPEANHGEDVKELYYYLDSSPTHSYLKALYKYPQAEFPYAKLVEEGRGRSRAEPEFEITDSGVFDANRYFDVVTEYAKGSSDDVLIRITVTNHGEQEATIHVLPTLWFRNTWSWGTTTEGSEVRPWLRKAGANAVATWHPTLGKFRWVVEKSRGAAAPQLLFTENETNRRRLYGVDEGRFVKDGINDRVIRDNVNAVNPKNTGTKVAAWFTLTLAPGEKRVIRARLTPEKQTLKEPFGSGFDRIFKQRIADCDAFYDHILDTQLSNDQRNVARQSYAGLLWSKQFYHYIVKDWMDGDSTNPPPPFIRRFGRNRDWGQLFNRDVISMPDKWEYPWYAAWDLAFHMIPMARVDPLFAKEQLVLMLREWYMHPNGQLPAYEFAFGDVNPPVHAWAVWRVYKMTGRKGHRDRLFLARCFQKLLINFTWWVNRKDVDGKNIFGGGFLGLDNIGIFDRSKPLPGGRKLEQADGTAWMAFYCGTMLSIALELASEDPEYEDVASKFFEHFVAIVDAINTVGGTGLWDETDGFYYDLFHTEGQSTHLRTRSMVGIIPLFACEILEQEVIEKLPGFFKRTRWFIEHRKDLSRFIEFLSEGDVGRPDTHQKRGGTGHYLLAIPSRKKLERVLRYILDEKEFLSPFGVRSLSKVHDDNPYRINIDGAQMEVRYCPGESDTNLFGGNSNWRGPIWFPVNFLLIEALERYHHYFGDSFKVECPTGSGTKMTLKEVARELSSRLTQLFVHDKNRRRPCHGDDARYATDPNFKDLILFYEHFHGETGRGIGASHQTGWTSLVAQNLEKVAKKLPPKRAKRSKRTR